MILWLNVLFILIALAVVGEGGGPIDVVWHKISRSTETKKYQIYYKFIIIRFYKIETIGFC